MCENRIILKEGRLIFLFDDSFQQAKKYDELEFYRLHFCRIQETKAVDIICIDSENTYLIEIKDYSHHSRTKTEPLHQEIAKKIRDSIAGLYWASKMTLPALARESEFAKRALEHDMKLVFHCEVPIKMKDLLAVQRQALKKIFRTIDRNLIVDCKADRFPWKIQKGPYR